jgi:hypothetical protein
MENKLRYKGLHAFTFLFFLSAAANAQTGIGLNTLVTGNFNTAASTIQAAHFAFTNIQQHF